MSNTEPIQSRSVWIKTVRYGLKPLAWIVAIMLLIWAGFWLYVIKNEDDLKKRVANAIRAKTKGDVEIGKLSVSFLRTFPLLSLQLTDVLIKDSITGFAHKDFLRAEDIYLRVSIAGLITGRSPVGKILLRNGEINIATDSSGKSSNEYIFKTKPRNGREPATSFPVVELQNMSASYVHPSRRKNYAAIVHSLKCSAKDKDGTLRITMNVRMLAKNITFNTIKGAYMREKMLEGKFVAFYDRESKDLFLNNVKLLLDNHPYYFNAQFNLEKGNSNFQLNISSQDVTFSNAASLLTPPIQKALKPYSVVEPVDLDIKLLGKTVMNHNPMVEVKMNVKNNKVITPQGLFEDCSFNGIFSNELVKGKDRNDDNSYLLFTGFRGRWENIPLTSDTIKISGLIKPYLECDVASNVDMKTVNKLADSKTFEFLDGRTSFKVDFKGPVLGGDTISNINGFINIKNASFRYNPRNMLLSDCNGVLRFVNNDLLVDKLNAGVGETKLLMSGSAENFLSLLNVSPEKLVLQWNIKSPQLHLDDFKPLLSTSQSKQKSKASNKEGMIAKTSSKVDKMFSEGDMHISLESPVMDYKTFKATDVKAAVVFTPAEIRMDRVSFNHAGGYMHVNAIMKNGQQKNPVSLHVNMERMDIPQLFTAFDNFGQDAVTNKNLKGRLSADINYTTAITNKAELVSADSEGQVNFLLEGGELNNFEPLGKISEKAFKKQDFSNIKFADLKNRLDLKGTTFIINSMDIRSTALNLTVEGVYDIKKGTDMFIKLPLRNLLKSQANTDISDNGKAARGVSLRLRAKTGDDGKLKVSWDPLRLAKRNKKDVVEEAEKEN